MMRLALAAAAVGILSFPVLAQEMQTVPPGEQPVAPYTASNANADARPIGGTQTFDAFGGEAGVRRVVDRTIDASVADARIADIFRNQDIARLRRTLTEQICYLIGGPCSYSGRDMATSHANMGIQTRDFNILVEHLQRAMRAEHVPYVAQHQLLALLAPMHRDIVGAENLPDTP